MLALGWNLCKHSWPCKTKRCVYIKVTGTRRNLVEQTVRCRNREPFPGVRHSMWPYWGTAAYQIRSPLAELSAAPCEKFAFPLCYKKVCVCYAESSLWLKIDFIYFIYTLFQYLQNIFMVRRSIKSAICNDYSPINSRHYENDQQPVRTLQFWSYGVCVLCWRDIY